MAGREPEREIVKASRPGFYEKKRGSTDIAGAKHENQQPV